MYTLYGTPCPRPGPGKLVATSCSGNLVTVPASFPGSRSPGPLFPTPEAADAFRRELAARACERLALRAADTALAEWDRRFYTPAMATAAARYCRAGRFGHALVHDVLRYAGPIHYEYTLYGLVLPAGAVEG